MYKYSAYYSRHFCKKISAKKLVLTLPKSLTKLYPKPLKNTDSFPESGSRKHFQDSGMRAIDSPHKITPRGLLVKKNLRKFFFGDRAANGTPLNCGCDIEFTIFFHFPRVFTQKFANDLK